MGKVIGIDLGTTRSVMAIMRDGEPVVIPNAEGYRTTPSVVAFLPDGRTLVGEAALRQIALNPTGTIRSVKRFIGRTFSEPAVVTERQYVAYNVVAAPNDDVWIEVNGKAYSPTEISAIILRKLKADAELYLGEPISQAVVTVPAYFSRAQREATYKAAALAGISVLRIINEPTAASLAYGLDRKQDERILVYDFGGGTFDVSILELGEGVFEVKSTRGDAHLGGDDFDERIVGLLAQEFHISYGLDPREDMQAYHRLREAAENLKIELSQVHQANVTIPFLLHDNMGPKHLVAQLTRSDLEESTADLIDRSLDCVYEALGEADVIPRELDHIVLAGGMTRMPAIRERLASLFHGQLHHQIHQDEAVALGAAIQAGVLSGDVRDVLLLDVISHSLGIELANGDVCKLIERNTTIPAQMTRIVTTANDIQRELDIHLLEGDARHTDDNSSLGLITISSLSPMRHGTQEFEVIVDIDANNTVSLGCREKDSGRQIRTTITGAERRLARPRPEALPMEFSVPSSKKHAYELIPVDALHKHKEAWETASNIVLSVAHSENLPLWRRGTWQPDESLRLRRNVYLVASEQFTDTMDFSVSVGGRILATLTANNIALPARGPARVSLRIMAHIPSATSMADRDITASLDLHAYDLHSEQEWNLSVPLPEGVSGSHPPRILPTYINADMTERSVAPPPIRTRTSVADGASTTFAQVGFEQRVFVSHTHADNNYCRAFVNELRASGVNVWYDEDDMSDGMLLDIVQRELGSRPIFIVILSPAALNSSPWVKLEVGLAFEKMLHDKRWHMLPVVGAGISARDLDERWLALQTLYRIEGEPYRPLPPDEAARQSLRRLGRNHDSTPPRQ